MKRLIAALGLALSLTGPTWAAQPGQAPVIERTYVSPGASGSVDSSSSWQRSTGYGGVRLPRGYGESSSHTVIIDSSGNGGIRQSIEYPNGVQLPRGVDASSSGSGRQGRP
ncbi:MAG: hypothetical protein GAK45_01505 [Pseudomonas citronellolis]|nr:MAG: hypothetical protein GAK45_01505 [Pseudomonas citronellolis]